MTYKIISFKILGSTYYYSEAEVANLASVWKQAALELSGVFTPGKDSVHDGDGEEVTAREQMTIQAQLDGADVLVEHFYKRPSTYTRLSSNRKGGPKELQLTMYRQDLAAGLKKALGAPDLTLGQKTFDQLFIVQSTDEELCKAWISPELREKIVSCPAYTYKMSDQQVVVQREGIESDLTTLTTIIEITAALASGWSKILSNLQAAAEALRGSLLVEPGSVALNKLRLSWLHQNLPCVVTFAKQARLYQKSATATCLQIRYPRVGKEYYLFQQKLPKAAEKLPLLKLPNHTLQLRSKDPEVARHCNEEVLSRLCQLPFSGISSNREAITIWLPGVITALSTLTSACEVLSLFVQSSSASPYR